MSQVADGEVEGHRNTQAHNLSLAMCKVNTFNQLTLTVQGLCHISTRKDHACNWHGLCRYPPPPKAPCHPLPRARPVLTHGKLSSDTFIICTLVNQCTLQSDFFHFLHKFYLTNPPTPSIMHQF